MFVIVIAVKYALLVSQWSYGHFLELIGLVQFYLNNTINLRHLTRRIMPRYTHKMANDSVTSFHPVYFCVTSVTPREQTGWLLGRNVGLLGLSVGLEHSASFDINVWHTRKKCNTRVARKIPAAVAMQLTRALCVDCRTHSRHYSGAGANTHCVAKKV